jgi:peptidoglycan/LPS O-acetylase OafA/YrhL
MARVSRLPALDGWRAIAIGMVMASHAASGFIGSGPGRSELSIFSYGDYGVEVFFAISGLLITKLLLDEFDSNGTVSLQAFYVRRAFRILPLVFVYLSFVGALGWFIGPLDWLAPIFFFRNYVGVGVGASYFTAHFWTLAIEEHFYLLWPVILVLALRRNAVRTLIVVATITSAAYSYVGFRLQDYFPYLHTVRSEEQMFAILWGAAAAVVLHYQRDWLTKKFHFPLFVLFVIAYVCLITNAGIGKIHVPGVMGGPLMAAVVLGPVCRPDWLIGRFLDLTVLRWIGRISYSLYIWQQIFLVGGQYPHYWGWIQRFPQNIVAALAVAVASYYLMEKPLIAIGRRLAARVIGFQPSPKEPAPITAC